MNGVEKKNTTVGAIYREYAGSKGYEEMACCKALQYLQSHELSCFGAIYPRK